MKKIDEKHPIREYDIRYFLNMAEQMKYNPQIKDIQYPGRRRRKLK